MRTLDRYIVRNFLFAALLWFVVLMSLRVVTDLFVNMDEFAKHGRSFGQMLGDISSYYGYQSLAYFTELGGVIVVAAAAFSLARMNHTNELTAMLASGVSLYRVIWPILLCAMILCGLIIIDRELIIPKVAHKLVRDRDEVQATEPFSIWLMDDENSAIWYSPKFRPADEVMEKPVIVIRDSRGRKVADIRGWQACPVKFDNRSGWAVTGKSKPAPDTKEKSTPAVIMPATRSWTILPNTEKVFTSIAQETLLKKISTGGDWVALSIKDSKYDDMRTEGEARFNKAVGRIEITRPTFTFVVGGMPLGTFFAASAVYHSGKGGDNYWQLNEGKLFFASDLTTEDLVLRRCRRWQAYLSVRQLTRLLRLKRVADPDSVMLLIQARVTDPINNLLMLLVGLPFILSRERNIKSSAGLCLLMVGTFYVFIYICRYMALPPMLAAWLPILLFGPIAAVMLDAVKT